MSNTHADEKLIKTRWLNIFISLFSIFLLRIFLESFSSPIDISGTVPPWQGYLLHIPLSYFAIFLSLVLIIYLITKSNIKKIAIFLTYAHLLLLLPPILDFIIDGRKPNSIIGYQFLNLHELISYIKKVWLFDNVDGTTFGMRIAAILLALMISFFILKQTRNRIKTLIGFFSVFLTMFLYANIPSFLIIIQLLKNTYAIDPIFIWKVLIKNSWTNSNALQSFDIAYALIMSQIFFLLITLQLSAIFYFLEKKSWLAILHNLRPERILNYFLLAFIGILISIEKQSFFDIISYNIINLVSFFSFAFLLVLNALIAIFTNDFYDLSTDKISNQHRPLIRNAISLKRWKAILFALIILFIFGLLTMNSRVILFMLMTQLLFFIYSAPPLQLKRYFLSSSILIGLTTGCTALAGFFLVSPEKTLLDFPYKILLTIIIAQAFLSNMKDIKDFSGDKNENIKTLPVILGLRKAKVLIAIIYAIVFITIPVFFSITGLIYPALFLSILNFYFFTKKIYNEKYIFLTIFSYLLALFFYTLY
ncbi:MAG: UbiA prenyltransferase [Candidatus Moranbacteria bacterium GW2011_GWE1_36_7]|nr:MAG: UbiA prenyltransferase [Candidatus Moranbacteria bacterium GW2011_GWD2_36_12]KKQ04456.1 MAG: UbiA prenyltransferase [Candidatus Moranbacteria bacterium GW2011_GWE2_36_40]KKQ11506.1 MAG: UbiA prenyltransferase [Candidatus Moranbacteria bacterium GW2011_GWE1_36_7]